VGLTLARIYGSLFSMEASDDPTRTAYGDRWLPELWASSGVAFDVFGPIALGVDALVRGLPSTMFHAEHVPQGTAPEFFPIYRHPHALSTYGARVGLTFSL
jgi:hypothetical protein